MSRFIWNLRFRLAWLIAPGVHKHLRTLTTDEASQCDHLSHINWSEMARRYHDLQQRRI
jgi:hypothetical protein